MLRAEPCRTDGALPQAAHQSNCPRCLLGPVAFDFYTIWKIQFRGMPARHPAPAYWRFQVPRTGWRTVHASSNEPLMCAHIGLTTVAIASRPQHAFSRANQPAPAEPVAGLGEDIVTTLRPRPLPGDQISHTTGHCQ